MTFLPCSIVRDAPATLWFQDAYRGMSNAATGPRARLERGADHRPLLRDCKVQGFTVRAVCLRKPSPKARWVRHAPFYATEGDTR